MIHVVQLFGGLFGLTMVWCVFKLIEIREQKRIAKDIEEVRKQYNK